MDEAERKGKLLLSEARTAGAILGERGRDGSSRPGRDVLLGRVGSLNPLTRSMSYAIIGLFLVLILTLLFG